MLLLHGRRKILKAFESGIFPKVKQTKGKGRWGILACVTEVSDCKQLKILTPNQILQRLPIALA